MSERVKYDAGLTLADLWAVTEGEPTHELSRGELLVAEPPPGWAHGVIAANLVASLQQHANAHDLGQVVTCDTWFVLQRAPDTVRGPDVAFVRRERCENMARPSAAFEGAPDLAVEVLSPSDSTSRVERKVQDYERAGVEVIWLVDPQSETITVIEHGQRNTLLNGDRLRLDQLLPGFSLAVAKVFT